MANRHPPNVELPQANQDDSSSSSDDEEESETQLDKSMEAATQLLSDLAIKKIKKMKLTSEEEQLVHDLVNILSIPDKTPMMEDSPIKDLAIFLRWHLTYKLGIVGHTERIEIVTNLIKLYKYFDEYIQKLDLANDAVGVVENPEAATSKTVHKCILCDEPADFTTNCSHRIKVCSYCGHKRIFLCPADVDCTWSGELERIVADEEKPVPGKSPVPSIGDPSSGSDDSDDGVKHKISMDRARALYRELLALKLKKLSLPGDEQILVKNLANMCGIPDKEAVKESATHKDLASFLRFLVTWRLGIHGYIERIIFFTNLVKFFKFIKAKVNPDAEVPQGVASKDDSGMNETYPCQFCSDEARYTSTCPHNLKLCPYHAHRVEIQCTDPFCSWNGAVKRIPQDQIN